MHPFWIILAVAIFMLAAFLTGYTMAQTREREAAKKIEANLRDLKNQKANLTKWVRSNWPDEFAAYRRGHREGYQQGVLQSPELELMAEAQE